ncbi:MAG TPA: zinc ribbon domain-containing protein [Vicinamibacterales bacterium]|jgi:putative FmdB family regulatory protein|nr:zinc ribbon domain-containing protein [Vicinamibacterales bacterium]
MPIFEYACKACGRRFEFLKLPATTTAPVCPDCRSGDLERLFSGFAVNTPELSKARVKDARRQLKESRNYKDKQVADAEYVQEHIREHTPED